MATVGGTATLAYAALTWSWLLCPRLRLVGVMQLRPSCLISHRRLTFHFRRSHRGRIALHRRFTFRIRDGLRDQALFTGVMGHMD